ncbi:MAG TPA: hypothetical protein VGM37_01275 [Armatimonadota bacterium]|jgi:hypothetical protein
MKSTWLRRVIDCVKRGHPRPVDALVEAAQAEIAAIEAAKAEPVPADESWRSGPNAETISDLSNGLRKMAMQADLKELGALVMTPGGPCVLQFTSDTLTAIRDGRIAAETIASRAVEGAISQAAAVAAKAAATGLEGGKCGCDYCRMMAAGVKQ